VQSAHARSFHAIERIDEAGVRRMTRLPGWSVGHVLTHLARNADSHVLRAEAAMQGEIVDQYVGGLEGRDADIETGSSRSAQALIEDVRRSGQALEDLWQNLPPESWSGRSRDAGGQVRFLFELPSRRWQEVEVHLVDLDVGVSHKDWPDEFVLEWLPRTRERMWAKISREGIHPHFDDPADELAWLYGRLPSNDPPQPPPWG